MRLTLNLCAIILLFSNAFAVSIRNFRSVFLNDGRIIGGETASLGQFPYQVGLQMLIGARRGTCGGSLISKNYVLTAAHCLDIEGIEAIEVHLGTLEIGNEDHKVITVPPANFIPHENYNAETIENDIALLKLPEDVTFSDAIQPIDLPTRSDIKLDMENKYLTISGWGRYSDELQNTAQFLQYAQVKVLNPRICSHFFNEILDSMICTYTGLGKGTCNGDSGGPLAYMDALTRRRFIVGLTSFGSDLNCVQAGWPSVFTRITSFLDWIAEHTDIVIKS